MMEPQVTMDQHSQGFSWLERHLEDKIFMFAVDDIVGMIEAVVCTKL